MTPCYYYEINYKGIMNFQEAPRGTLVYFFLVGDTNAALIITKEGRVIETLASLVKVIGNDIHRMRAEVVNEATEIGRAYIEDEKQFNNYKRDLKRLL